MVCRVYTPNVHVEEEHVVNKYVQWLVKIVLREGMRMYVLSYLFDQCRQPSKENLVNVSLVSGNSKWCIHWTSI